MSQSHRISVVSAGPEPPKRVLRVLQARSALTRELTTWYVVALFRAALAIVVVLRLLQLDGVEHGADRSPSAYDQVAKRVEFRPGW